MYIYISVWNYACMYQSWNWLPNGQLQNIHQLAKLMRSILLNICPVSIEIQISRLGVHPEWLREPPDCLWINVFWKLPKATIRDPKLSLWFPNSLKCKWFSMMPSLDHSFEILIVETVPRKLPRHFGFLKNSNCDRQVSIDFPTMGITPALP